MRRVEQITALVKAIVRSVRTMMSGSKDSTVPGVDKKTLRVTLRAMEVLRMKQTSQSTDTEDSMDTESELDEEELKEMMGDVMYLCCQRPEKRRTMLENADKGLIRQICECCRLILKEDIPITYEEKDKLEKHKKVMRALRDKKNSDEEKKAIVVQNGGGFLLSLIPTLIGALSSMLSK